VYRNWNGGVVGLRRGEGRRVPGAESGKHMGVGEGKVKSAGPLGSREGESSIDARDIEYCEAWVRG